MSPQLIEFLLGLFFVGQSLPGMTTAPVERPTIIQFGFGVTLVILAILKVSLIG